MSACVVVVGVDVYGWWFEVGGDLAGVFGGAGVGYVRFCVRLCVCDC